MKKIFILLAIALFTVALFGASGEKYSLRIEGIGDTINYYPIWEQVNNGVSNIMSDAEVTILPPINPNGSVDVICTIDGVIPVRAQTDRVTFTGGAGRVNITLIEATVGVIVGAEDTLSVVLSEWADTYRTVLGNNGITVTSGENTLTFQSFVPGWAYDSPTTEDISGTLSAEVQTQGALLPDVDGIDMLIYKYFSNIITIRKCERSANRDIH